MTIRARRAGIATLGVAGLAVALAGSVPVRTQEGGQDSSVVDTLIRGLQRRESMIRSVYMTMVKEVYSLPGPDAEERGRQGNHATLSKIRLWCDRDQFYQEEVAIASSTSSRPVEGRRARVEGFDGGHRYLFSKYDPHLGVRRYSGGGGPGTRGAAITGEYGWWFDVMYYYAFDKRHVLSNALAKQHPSLAGKEGLEGVECWKVTGSTEAGVARAWWIAPARGYVCLRLEETDATSFAAKQVRTTSVWSDLVELGEGLWFPRRVRSLQEVTLPDGTAYSSSAVQFTLHDLLVNRTSAFSPIEFALPLDADVRDDDVPAGVVGGDVTELADMIRDARVPDWAKGPATGAANGPGEEGTTLIP
jgi:hypothetical protein